MSETKLEKARAYEWLDERSERILLLRRANIKTCSISITPMTTNGVQCTGHMQKAAIFSTGNIFLSFWLPKKTTTALAASPAAVRLCPIRRHLAVFTSALPTAGQFPGRAVLQTQNIAIGDGLNYEKYAGNPVITPEMLPEGSSFVDFRDPKIWKCKDGSYRTVIAARDGAGHGIIVLFSSEDGLAWKFENVLAHDPEAAMWECPDIFELDGAGLFLTSQLNEYWQGSVLAKECKTMYFVGECGEEVSSFTFDETSSRPIDLGLDFYAPQTMVTPDGRRIMIGWMQNWVSLGNRLPGLPWYGQMTAPREIHVRDGILIQESGQRARHPRRENRTPR